MNPFLLNLTIHNTSSQQDNPSDYCFSIKPNCTVYRKENENISGIDSRLAEVFIEFKSHAQYDPFQLPPAPVEGGNLEAEHFLSHLTGRRRNVLGQLGKDAVHIDSQYRARIGTYARLMRWDRCGVVLPNP